MLELREIRTDEFPLLRENIKRDFAFYEHLPLFLIKRCLKKMTMAGFFLCEAGIVEYALLVAPKNYGYVHLHNIAIHPNNRSKGMGSAFMRRLMNFYPNRTFIIEVLGTTARKAQDEESARRIKFYESLGFDVISHSQYKLAGKEMTVMANGECGDLKKAMGELYRPLFRFVR